VRLIFIGEKVRPNDLAEIPASDPVRTKEGIWICPVAGLVRMKLTSFRLKDKVHIQNLDSVGLITPEIGRPFRTLCASVFTKSALSSSFDRAQASLSGPFTSQPFVETVTLKPGRKARLEEYAAQH
jgi:hypothetical protein